VYRTKALLSLAVILFIASASIASNIIYYVDANSPNAPGSGTYEDPFRKIQDAINIAVNSDIVEIQPGLYTGPGNYNLDPNGKSITIRSINPNAAANTIIDLNKAGRGFCFQNNEDANCILSGLTIRNGYTADSGGGIYCVNSKPLITNCIITNNTADFYGGGIYCYNASPKITYCIIRNNSAAYDGGGLQCMGGAPEITNCIITNNMATGMGGGVDFSYPSNPTLTNCTIAGNYADSGGGLSCTDSNVVIQNSILWQNHANQGTQMALEPNTVELTVTISYSNLQGGQAAVYDSCAGLIWGSGNINADPCFASFDPNGDPNLWDFHLQSAYGRWNPIFYKIDFNNDGTINLADFAILANVWLQGGNLSEDIDSNGIINWMDLELFAQYYLANSHDDGWLIDASTSPCIDAGDPNSDWTAESWPNGKRINMGAYGGTNQASKNGNPADFNIDNSVNFADFAQMANQWLVEQMCIEDLTNDGKVNFADISIFAENWLWEKK